MYKRSWLVFAGVLLVLSSAVFALTVFSVIPYTASLAVPGKWRRVPLRQPVETVTGYFGTAAYLTAGSEVRVAGSTRRRYLLNLYYAPDSTVTAYSIYYQYRSLLINRDYLVDSASAR